MMAASQSMTWRHVLTCVGILLLNLPNGIPWLYGNLITYINSYLLARRGTVGFDLNPTWPLAMYSITYSVGLAVPGIMVPRLGLRLTTLCIIIVLDLVLLLSYLTSQVSIGLLGVTLGLLGGLAIGAIACVSLYYMCGWFPDHIGRACAFSSCSVSGGSIFTNILLTFYINPDNLQPDVLTDTASYFSQDALLDRVPRVFLVFGTMSLSVHLLGLLLLQPPPMSDIITMETNQRHPNNTDSVDQATESVRPPGGGSQHQLHGVDDSISHLGSSGTCLEQSQASQTQYGTAAAVQKVVDVRPLQALQGVTFYLMWSAVGIFMYGLLLANNFYKQYGQSRILDDSYFALVASLNSLGSIGGRLWSGYLLDKCDLKDSLMVYLAINTLLCIFWFHSLHIHRVVYLLVSVLIIAECNMAFVLAPYAALKLYGPQHLSTNTSLIFSSNVLVSLLIPVISQPILATCGWFWLFQTDSIPSLLVLISVLVFLRLSTAHT